LPFNIFNSFLDTGVKVDTEFCATGVEVLEVLEMKRIFTMSPYLMTTKLTVMCLDVTNSLIITTIFIAIGKRCMKKIDVNYANNYLVDPEA
jgi:hypothetical protein